MAENSQSGAADFSALPPRWAGARKSVALGAVSACTLVWAV